MKVARWTKTNTVCSDNRVHYCLRCGEKGKGTSLGSFYWPTNHPRAHQEARFESERINNHAKEQGYAILGVGDLP